MVITKTYTTRKRAITILERTKSKILMGIHVRVPGTAEAGLAAEFWKNIVQRKRVLYRIYYKPHHLSKDLKAEEDRSDSPGKDDLPLV